MSYTQIKMTNKGKRYKIDDKQYNKLESLLFHAKETMTNPCIFHFCSRICDTDKFDKANFATSLKRAIKKQYSSIKQESPNILFAYSVEHKFSTAKEINGEYDNIRSMFEHKLSYLHIHIYIIADCIKCNPINFPNYGRKAINSISGLDTTKYNKAIDGSIYKKVDDDNFDDVFSRLLYIGKLDQKDEYIPFRETFGMSRIVRKID